MGSMPSGAYSSQQAPRKEKTPSGYRQFAQNVYTPEQEDTFSEARGLIDPNSFTSRLAKGDQSAFAEMEEPALRQFNDISGGLASKFSGMGMGGRNSSGFQNSLTSAGQDFASQLQSKRLELRNQAIKDMMGMTSEFLGYRPQEKGLVEKRQKKPKWWQEAGQHLLNAAAKEGGKKLAGGWGSGGGAEEAASGAAAVVGGG